MREQAINACPEVRRMKLADLHPSPSNPRTISDEALSGLSKSLERFGCVEPLVVNVRNVANTIVGGHQRYRALKEAGVQECLVICVDVDPKEEKLLNVSLNNPNIQGQFSDSLPGFIDDLRINLDEQIFSDLQLDALAPANLGLDTAGMRRENLEPYRRTHVLLSFAPDVLPEIDSLLEQIRQCPEVEYEQSSN
jgi:hypothetical protein